MIIIMYDPPHDQCTGNASRPPGRRLTASLTTEAVIQIDHCTRSVEDDIAQNTVLAALGAEVERTLLLVNTDLAHKVGLHGGEARLRASCAVKALGVSPRHHKVHAQPRGAVAADGHMASEPAQDDGVVVEAAECIVGDVDPLRAVDVDGRAVVARPVSPAGHAPALKECRGGIAHANT